MSNPTVNTPVNKHQIIVAVLFMLVVGAAILNLSSSFLVDNWHKDSPRELPPEKRMLRFGSEYTEGSWTEYKNISIAMIGDSNFEYEKDWNKLAGRMDIATFAISGFPAVYFEKLEAATLVAKSGSEGVLPKALMMLGTNDILYGVPPAEVKESIVRIVTSLREKEIEVTLIAVPFCGKSRMWSKKRMLLVNSEIKELNELVTKWCEKNGVQIYDINPTVAPNGVLDPDFSIGDGLHLSKEGRDEIVKILVKVGQEVDQQPK